MAHSRQPAKASESSQLRLDIDLDAYNQACDPVLPYEEEPPSSVPDVEMSAPVVTGACQGTPPDFRPEPFCPELSLTSTTLHLTDESPDASEATAPESPSQQLLGIPHGNLPAMTTEAERLNALELTLAEERLKTERIENQLQQLIELLNPAQAATEPAPPGNAPSVQVMDEDTPLYFSIAGRAFQDEQARVSWALTFFKTGQAASFADRILRTQSRTGKPYFANWSAFKDPHGIKVQIQWTMLKFKKGLSKSLRTTVSTIDPPPAFDNLEAWIEAAQRVADARETSKVFEENIRAIEKPALHGPKALTTIPRTLPPAPPARMFNYQARLPIPVVNTHPELTKVPDGPVPMDVDRTRGKASISNIVCRRCGKTEHIARFCDTNFDVRSLTVEEKEELLYGLMADLDMSGSTGAELSGEEEVVSEREDFAKHDE
ncbi:hypothetical protein M422DRAFT_246232 [Sphaerobolus stellatus SS14]|nr:hypothetical protein M422DRAFT_246232 [Sphaerobolus stellatus SS14]